MPHWIMHASECMCMICMYTVMFMYVRGGGGDSPVTEVYLTGAKRKGSVRAKYSTADFTTVCLSNTVNQQILAGEKLWHHQILTILVWAFQNLNKKSNYHRFCDRFRAIICTFSRLAPSNENREIIYREYYF